MATTLYGTLAIDNRNLNDQRFVLRVPQVHENGNHPLQARDIQGAHDVALAAGQTIRVFNSAVVFKNLCRVAVHLDKHRELILAFARAALPVQLKTGPHLELGRLIPAAEVSGHEMCYFGFEPFSGTSIVRPLCNGDMLSVFEKVTLGHAVYQGVIATDIKPFKDGSYKSEDTGRRVDGCFPITLTSPPQMVMKIYASRGLPAEITCP